MTLFLSSENVCQYLLDRNVCEQKTICSTQVELVKESSKNFNLIINFADNYKLFIKQERHQARKNFPSELFNEWQFHQLLRQFSDLFSSIYPSVSEVLYFDEDNSIIVYRYLTEYLDLAILYREANIFPTEIAALIGNILAKLHRSTLNRQECRDFISQISSGSFQYQPGHLAQVLRRVEPEIFSSMSVDCLKFFALYQRYESLGAAVEDISEHWHPCCLTHNDLKLNNILIHIEWEQLLSQGKPLDESLLRLIDWERCNWGDPAFDLGTLLANYLSIWLNSFISNPAFEMVESLRLAVTPLEVIQPSIITLIRAYISSFPMVLKHRPDFLKRVVQFTGLALINQIWGMLQYQKSFGNTGICMLQVAKSLLCHPEQSVVSVFGLTESELTCLKYFPT